MADDDNVFETVRRTAARLEAVEMLLEGSARWQQTGIISLLREVRVAQAILERKITLLLSVTIFLLLLSLLVLTLLLLHMRAVL